MHIIVLMALMFAAGHVHAADAAMPGYDNNARVIPGEGPTPQVPRLTPEGNANLDHEWTEGGGARPYWNSVNSPQELKLDGKQWVDPANVKELPPLRASDIAPAKPAAKPASARPAKKSAAKKKAAKPRRARKARGAAGRQAIPLPLRREAMPPRQPDIDAYADVPFMEPTRLQ